MGIDAGKIIAYLDMDTTGFTHAFDTASEQLSGFADGGIEGALGSIGAAATTAGRALTLGITTPLLTAAGAAVSVGMGFDESMSNVYGLMSSLNLSQSQMDELRDTAREMGATTKFSASEAADAMGYMALAGWNDQQVIAGLPGVLNLAAAANMDLARASDIVTDTMTPFGIAADRAAEAADVFAYAQANSNTTVEALGEAMKYAAPSADAFGMTLQDTSAAMGILANAGIKGSQAGTTLNAMLRDMQKNAKNGAIAIGKTKVALTEADGSYRSYADIIRDIDKATQGMSESQKTAALRAIFGDESLKGVLATLKQGPDALDAMTQGMYACGGAAEGMAAIMQDNLKGELTTLSSGIQEMGIALSDFLTPILREGVSFVTDLVGKFNALDDGTKNMIFRAGALAAATGPVLTIGGKLLTVLSGVNPLVLGFGAAAALAYTHSETLQGIVSSMGDGVSAFGTALQNGASLLDAFSAGLTAAFGEEATEKVLGVIGSISGAFTTVGDALSTVTEAVGTFFGSLFDGEGLTQSWDNAAAVISGYDWAALGTSIWNGVTSVLDAAGEWLSNLFSAGLSAVQTIDWNALGTSIHDGVCSLIDSAGAWLSGLFTSGKDAAKGIEWGDIGTAIWNGVTSILDAAGSFLSGLFGVGKDAAVSGVDWAAIGSAIWGGVTGVIDAAGAWLSSLFSAGKTAAEGVPWSGIGSTILGGVTSAIDAAGAWLSSLFSAGKTAAEGVPWSGVGSAILGGVTGAIDTAGAWLSSLFSTGKTAAVGLAWGDVGAAISGGVTGTIDTAGVFLSGAFSTAKTAIEGIKWEDVGSTIAAGVNGAIDTAGAFLSGAFDAAKTAVEGIKWEDVGNAIATGVNGAIDTAGKFLSGAFEAAKTAISGIKWDEVGSTISQGISGAIDGLAKLGGSIWDTITGWFGGNDEEDAKGDAKSSGKSLTDGMETGITEGSTAVTAAANTAATAALGAAAGTLSSDAGIAVTTAWMGGLSSGITDAQETLTTDAQTAAQGAQTAAADCLTLDIGKEDGTAYMAGVSSGFNGARSALAADAKTVAGEAASAARTALAYSVGQGIGQNMVYGMAAGVRSGASAMYSTITSVANAAVRRAKSALRINSPSGVFADEVGAWIPGGIGVGVTKNMDDALGPLDEVRRSMVGLFDGALSGVTLGDPQIPWSPQGSGGGPTTVNININGDWTVRSDEDRDAILSELYERISDETRRR